MTRTIEKMICKECGAEVPFGKYCSECGAKACNNQGSQHYHTTFCVNCGSMTPDAKYCSQCGYEKDYQHF